VVAEVPTACSPSVVFWLPTKIVMMELARPDLGQCDVLYRDRVG
jgi:hypothetical protein